MDYYQAQEDTRAADFRAAKNDAKNSPTDNIESANQGSLRERLLRKRNFRKAVQEAAKEKVKSTVTSPLKQGTGTLLKYSWLNLVDSFGLTLIYINLHVFLRWIFPSIFCKLGEEWLPKQASMLNSEGSPVAGVTKSFGLVEVIGLLILDLAVIIFIIAALASILIVLDLVYEVFGWFIDWLSQAGTDIAA